MAAKEQLPYSNLKAGAVPVGAGSPAKQAPRWMARASPVFAGEPAPTRIATDLGFRVSLVTKQPGGPPARQYAPAAVHAPGARR
ncbi:hypothetical protein BL240_11775 [Pseudomonas putida]|uniref:Uncharacterized protein n=1 Tax=Pseudomonas putida TaxID=303 RepID=A0A1L5PPL1_PSEPU|nr:hypothetical protein BL240_11775 [Pseudomonas putida]